MRVRRANGLRLQAPGPDFLGSNLTFWTLITFLILNKLLNLNMLWFLLQSMGNEHTCLVGCKDCSHSGCPTSHSPRSASGPPFLHVLETTCLFNIDNSHLGWCEVTAHCDFTTWFVNKFFLALSPAYSLQILPGRFCRISRQHWKRHLLPLLAGSLLTLVWKAT